MKDLRSKLLIIELDGATWDVMDPLIAAGKLPNISRLINKGASGNLMSDPPLISPRLWVSIFSGKRSEEHGIEFFGSSSKMVRTKRIWDICNDRGLTVGVFGSFVTWPPYPVNGFIIPSLFSVGPDTYPPEYGFLQELTLGERSKNHAGRRSSSRIWNFADYARKFKKHGVSTRTILEGLKFSALNFVKRPPQDERYWKKGMLYQRICTEFFTYLYKKYNPHFATFHIHLCDAFSHRYWKYYEPEKFSNVDADAVARYRNVIPNSYIESDRTVGDFVSTAGPGATVIILSDHGSQAMETLRESFKLKPDIFLGFLGIDKTVIPANIGFMTFLYFQDKELMKKTSAMIEAMSFKDSGDKVFDVIYEESMFGVRLAEKFWGVAIDPAREIDAGELGCIEFSKLFSPHKMDVSGDHKLEGVFIASGPGIKEGVKIQDSSIYDITPTSLAVMGLPVARDMHGRVIGEMFTSAPDIQYVDSYDSKAVADLDHEEIDVDKVTSRLKALGYL